MQNIDVHVHPEKETCCEIAEHSQLLCASKDG